MTRDETPRDPLREALHAEVGRKLTDARIEELMRAEAIPLHGRGVSVDLQARGVAAAVRVAAMTAIDEALASSIQDALDEAWIDDLPGITQVQGVTFGELMVPVSAIRRHFAARGQQ